MRKRKIEYESVPDYKELVNPTFMGIKSLGGIAHVSDIHDEVLKIMNLSDEVLKPIHTGKNESEYFYRLKWVLTWMKNAGILEIPQYNMRKISLDYSNANSLGDEDINLVMSSRKNNLSKKYISIEDVSINDIIESDSSKEPWKYDIRKCIYNMNHYKFEEFCGILLEKCGIQNVKITQRSRDGGIDGEGKLMINEVFNMKIVFQCKHYKSDNTITAGHISKFRGDIAIRGDAEMGLFITTSKFTPDAKQKALTTSAKEIYLMDIDDIIDKVIKYNIGLKRIPVVDEDFYNNFK